MSNSNKLKFNFGGGPKKIEGYISVDAMGWEGITDIVWDLTNVPYEFARMNSVDEIIAIEMLEHISFRHTLQVLKEWYRILKDGGKLIIQVPDCGEMMKMYVNNEVCDCVKHKPKNDEDVKGLKDCWSCGGKARVNPERFLFAFTGAQKHSFDVHRNIFTKETMKDCLKEAGFEKVEIKNDKYNWKIIVNAYK